MYEKDTYIKLFYRSFYLCQSKLNDNSLLKKKNFADGFKSSKYRHV